MSTFLLDDIKALRLQLTNHPIYTAIQTVDDLTLFMQHHVYSVWDFMSLVKYLQHTLAPTTLPWLPQNHGEIQRFINDIVLEEESDESLPLSSDGTTSYTSHFNLYRTAMEEIAQGSTNTINEFIQSVSTTSLTNAMTEVAIPAPCKAFMQTTFEFIQSDKPHMVAAAFALGREHIIPEMFRALLDKMHISRQQAEVFHYYLDRHIELDGDHHGPLSLRMLDILCENSPSKIAEAQKAAQYAIKTRIAFWDGVLLAIQTPVNPIRK